MLVAKYRLEQELAKFRPVVPVSGQYDAAKRSEAFDLGTHQHMPAGGRINLRALYDCVMMLAEAVRQHRSRLPPLPAALPLPAEAVAGPPDWCPDRHAAEREEEEARRRAAEAEERRREAVTDDTWRQDLLNWIDRIPLAASCCAKHEDEVRKRQEVQAAAEAAARGHAAGEEAKRAARRASMLAPAGLAFSQSIVQRQAMGSARGQRGGAGAVDEGRGPPSRLASTRARVSTMSGS